MIEAINRPGTVGINAQVTQRASRRRLKVLCATDMSLRSQKAMRRAALLVQQLDAQMLLLHVVDETQSARMIRRKAERARVVLYWQARKLAKTDGGRQVAVRVGTPHQTIASVAKEWGADLIILGSYRRRFGDSFLGTTAEHVIRAARRPVLIVNRKPAGPYADVLLAVDRPDTFAPLARLTQDLGLLEGASVSVVQALAAPNRMLFYAAGMTEPRVGQYMQHVKQSSADEISAQLDVVGLDSARTSVIQKHASPFYAIERATERTRSDLVVVGACRFPVLKRVVLGSVSNEVLRKIGCDVLVASPAAVRRVQTREHRAVRGREFASAIATSPRTASSSRTAQHGALKAVYEPASVDRQ